MTIRSLFKISTRLAVMLMAGLVLLTAASSAQAGFRGIARTPSGAFKAVNPPHRLPPCTSHHIGVCH